jgi:acyl carrier protein
MPQPVPAQIEAGVIAVLKAVSSRPIEPTLASDLIVDLGFDSVRVLEVIAELEDRFDVSIPLNDLPSTRTVAQVGAVAALSMAGRTPDDGFVRCLKPLPAAARTMRATSSSPMASRRGARSPTCGWRRSRRSRAARGGVAARRSCGWSLATPAVLDHAVAHPGGNHSRIAVRPWRPATRRRIAKPARIIRLAGARAIITTSALRPQFDDMRSSCPSIDLVLSRETLDARPLEPDHTASLDDIALVQFTSGSTAVPKGVVLTHRSLSANIDAINGPAGLGSSSTDSALSWLPLYHDMGLIGMALGPLYCGRPAVLLTPQAFVKHPAEWLRAISRHRATVSFAPNFAYDLCVRRVKERDLDGLDLSCWRVAGCGGEPIHAPTLAAFAEKFAPVGFRETSFLPCYGLAEHGVAAAFAPRGRRPRVEQMPTDDLTDRRPAAPNNATAGSAATLVSCVRPFPGHRLRIVDQDGRELPESHVGEIALAGPSVMLSYYRQDELTAATSERLVVHRRPWVCLGRRAVRLRACEGHHHRQRTQVPSAGSGMGPGGPGRRPPRPRRRLRCAASRRARPRGHRCRAERNSAIGHPQRRNSTSHCRPVRALG